MTLESGGARVVARKAQRFGGARRGRGLSGWDWAGQHLTWLRGERCEDVGGVIGKDGIR